MGVNIGFLLLFITEKLGMREDVISLISSMLKSISRFARNTATTIAAIREHNGYGIKTIFEKENLVSMDPGTNIMLSLMASTAESESLSINVNMNLGPKYKYSRGWSANFTNFPGYDKLPDGTINAEQAETIK